MNKEKPMRPFIALLAALLLASPLQAAEIPDNVAKAVAAAERPAKDRERDARDKPAELLAFAGVKPGDSVADVFGGGGYWTELLSRAVAPGGSVTLVNNVGYFAFDKDAIKERFKEGRLADVKQRVVETPAMGLGKDQYDLILIFMAYHDLYWVDEANGWPKIDAGRFLDQLHEALKPGGHLLIVDHAAQEGTGSAAAQDLHRIDEAFAKKDIASHGFLFEKAYTGYRNSADDHSKLVFDPSVRGKTDRFAHLYRKN
jgi:predicted methyltransferase